MSKIISPSNDEMKDVSDNPDSPEKLNRAQRRRAERNAKKQAEEIQRLRTTGATMLEVVGLDQGIRRVAQSLAETDFSFMALAEILVEAGITTQEDIMEKEQEILDRYTTPNSPAADEAKKAARESDEKRTVERLDEVPPTDTEKASRRIVEG